MKLRILLCVVFVALASAASAQTAVSTWSNTGPVLFPENVSGQVNGMGRVTQIKFDPIDSSRIYAVSASGGLFVSNDTGNTWAQAGTDQLPTTQCSSMCVDNTNNHVLYLSTGDQNYYYEDYGIWKSTDAGTTWNPANTGIGNRMAVEIIMDPVNHNTLVAATDDGIWKTTNGGTTWTETLAGLQMRSMKMRPGSHTVLYAATGSDFYRSVNMGSTWTHITSGVNPPSGNEGIRIAVTPADTNLVILGTTDGYGEIFKSTNGGTSFSNIYTSTSQCIVCYDSTITSGSQGYYNFNLTINPANANELLLVSHCVWRSTDGGNTWSWRTQWYDQMHTDMHDIEFDPYNLSKRFDANDGGFWMSNDTLATTWTPRSNGLAATEVYHAAQSPLIRQMVSIGTQDNGENYFDGTWKCNRGGDWSAHNAFDYLGNATVYYMNAGNRRNLLPLGGDQTFNSPFVPDNNAMIEFMPKKTNIAFAGKDSLWRSTNIDNSSPSWTLLYVPGGDDIQSIASSRADSNVLYFVTNNNTVYRSDNALAATPSFTALAAPYSTNAGASLTTDKHNVNVVYLSCNDSVYRSANKGASWTNITGTSLPGLNILKIIADDYSVNERLFLCAGNYVYYKDNTTTTWTNTTGLPTIPQITDFMIYNDSTSASILRLSTYGRGVWECSIDNNERPTGDFTANKQYLCPGDTVHYNKSMYGSISSFSWSFPGGTPATSTADSPVVVYHTPGTYNATLTLIGTAGNDSVIKTAYIVVSNGTVGALTEGFEEATFPPGPQWYQLSQSGNMWQQSALAGGYGTSAHSMYFDNFDNDAGGRHDRIVTPKTDLTPALSAYVTFDVAYAYYTGYHDSLQVEISTDCGHTFTVIYEKDSNLLATAPDTTASFVPRSNEWRTDSISLNDYLGTGMQLAFDNIGHYGENIYIDNVNIHVKYPPAAVANVNSKAAITLFPNPTTGIITIKGTDLQGHEEIVNCYNSVGRLVMAKTYAISNGTISETLNLSGFTPGVYILKITSGDGSVTVKQVVLE
jgi:PKD repeat protein/photosystem II stability/assembly factor-like uncharacterized protein